MMHEILQAMIGANMLASAVIALFFVRFWVRTGDRFFALFAAGFILLAINWIAIAVIGWFEGHAGIYLLRLAGFLLIIFAIIDKNRSTKSASAPPRSDVA